MEVARERRSLGEWVIRKGVRCYGDPSIEACLYSTKVIVVGGRYSKVGDTSISPEHTNTNTHVVTPLMLDFIFLTEFSMNFDATSRRRTGKDSSTPPYISFLSYSFPS